MIENIILAEKSYVITLPDNLSVRTYVDLTRCTNLESLPSNLWIGWSLYLNYCISLYELPKDLYVGDRIYVYGCQQRIIDECLKREIKMVPDRYNLHKKEDK